MKYPKELFVVVTKHAGRFRGELAANDQYTAAGKKRIESMLSGGGKPIKNECGVWVYRFYKWPEIDHFSRARAPVLTFGPVPDDEVPRVWQNVPLTGFKIIDFFITGRSNKKWMIEDPRGIDFPITTRSLNEIIKNCIIDNGVILNPCIWKSSENLVAT